MWSRIICPMIYFESLLNTFLKLKNILFPSFLWSTVACFIMIYFPIQHLGAILSLQIMEGALQFKRSVFALTKRKKKEKEKEMKDKSITPKIFFVDLIHDFLHHWTLSYPFRIGFFCSNSLLIRFWDSVMLWVICWFNCWGEMSAFSSFSIFFFFDFEWYF